MTWRQKQLEQNLLCDNWMKEEEKHKVKLKTQSSLTIS